MSSVFCTSHGVAHVGIYCTVPPRTIWLVLAYHSRGGARCHCLFPLFYLVFKFLSWTCVLCVYVCMRAFTLTHCLRCNPLPPINNNKTMPHRPLPLNYSHCHRARLTACLEVFGMKRLLLQAAGSTVELSRRAMTTIRPATLLTTTSCETLYVTAPNPA